MSFFIEVTRHQGILTRTSVTYIISFRSPVHMSKAPSPSDINSTGSPPPQAREDRPESEATQTCTRSKQRDSMRFASVRGSKVLPFVGCFHTAQGLLTRRLDVFHAKQFCWCLIYDAIKLVRPTQNSLISSMWELQLCDIQHYKMATDHRMVSSDVESKQLSIKPI